MGRFTTSKIISPPRGNRNYIFNIDILAPWRASLLPCLSTGPLYGILFRIFWTPKRTQNVANISAFFKNWDGNSLFGDWDATLPTFLAIFRNEITTILTPSTSEGGEWGRWGWSRFSFWRSLITNPQYIYIITRSKICNWLKLTRKFLWVIGTISWQFCPLLFP